MGKRMSEVKYAIAILKEKLANADRHNLAYQRLSIAEMEAIWGALEKSDKDCATLKAERDALAAENAIMLKLLTDISENHVEYFSEGESGMFAGVPLDYVSEINMYVSRDVNAENPFAATDAYLNSVRAEGAIAVRNALALAEDGADIYATSTLVANQLRAGEPS